MKATKSQFLNSLLSLFFTLTYTQKASSVKAEVKTMEAINGKNFTYIDGDIVVINDEPIQGDCWFTNGKKIWRNPKVGADAYIGFFKIAYSTKELEGVPFLILPDKAQKSGFVHSMQIIEEGNVVKATNVIYQWARQ